MSHDLSIACLSLSHDLHISCLSLSNDLSIACLSLSNDLSIAYLSLSADLPVSIVCLSLSTDSSIACLSLSRDWVVRKVRRPGSRRTRWSLTEEIDSTRQYIAYTSIRKMNNIADFSCKQCFRSAQSFLCESGSSFTIQYGTGVSLFCISVQYRYRN